MHFDIYEWDLIADLLENRKHQLEGRDEPTEKRDAKAELYLIECIRDKMAKAREEPNVHNRHD